MANYPIYPYGQGQTMPAGYPIANDLVTDNAQMALSAAMGKELNDKLAVSAEIDLDDYELLNSFINTNEAHSWLNNYDDYACKLIPVSSGETYKITAGANGGRMAVLVSNSTTGNAQFADGYTAPVVIAENAFHKFTVPSNGNYLYVVMYTTKDLSPAKVEKLEGLAVYDNIVEMFEAEGGGGTTAQPHIPSILKVGDPTNIIYTIDDFLLAHDYIEGSTDTLKASLDLGKTWHIISDDLTNDYGNVTNAFMFSDGTFMFCTKDSTGCHAFWIRDFENMTVNACTINDYNGAFVPGATHVSGGETRLDTRFYNVDRVTHHTYKDGVEYYCFGDYTISTGHPRLWYSCDNGRTIRCAFAFGYSQINGQTVSARHIHGFLYNKYDGYFYALTGDHISGGVSECNIMRGRHDANHVWTWELLKRGQEYKLVAISFDEGNMYAVTDYTDASLVNAKGIVSLPMSSLDVADMRYLFHASKEAMKEGSYYSNPSDSNVAAVSSYFADNRGWRIAGSDYLGNSKLLIARGDHNFVWVDNDKGLKFGNWMGPNNNGDSYATFTTPNPSQYTSGEGWLRISHRQSYNVTEVFRNSGMTDFFEGWKGTEY